MTWPHSRWGIFVKELDFQENVCCVPKHMLHASILYCSIAALRKSLALCGLQHNHTCTAGTRVTIGVLQRNLSNQEYTRGHFALTLQNCLLGIFIIKRLNGVMPIQKITTLTRSMTKPGAVTCGAVLAQVCLAVPTHTHLQHRFRPYYAFRNSL